jgi:hypothetical protein
MRQREPQWLPTGHVFSFVVTPEQRQVLLDALRPSPSEAEGPSDIAAVCQLDGCYALRAAPPYQRWQLFVTAPNDGTEILAWRKDAGVMLVRWTAPVDFLSERELDTIDEESAHAEGWFYADFVRGERLEGDMVPTHWMPLPAAPGRSEEK